MPAAKIPISEIKVLVIDLDGCLTNGTLTIDQAGKKLFKQFHTRDVRAIRELVANGVEVYIVSADDWGGGKHFAAKVGAEFINLKDKSDVRRHIGNRPFACIGDDSWDIPMLEQAEYRFCPSDAFTPLIYYPEMNVLPIEGGKGVVAAFLQWYYNRTELEYADRLTAHILSNLP